MLILTRKKGETIRISDHISISVADVRAGRVRLAIDAPRGVRVLRQELIDADSGALRPTVSGSGVTSAAGCGPEPPGPS